MEDLYFDLLALYPHKDVLGIQTGKEDRIAVRIHKPTDAWIVPAVQNNNFGVNCVEMIIRSLARPT